MSGTPQLSNQAIRNIILYGGGPYPPATDIWQEITGFPVPANVGPGTTYAIYPRPVGLVKRLLVEFSATVTAGATSTQNLTKLGLANFFSNVTLYDLSNYQRINTTGWHLQAIASAKRRRVFGAAYTTSNPDGYGNNFASNQAASNIAANGNTVIKGLVEIPLAYNDHDLRGAVYASVTQATMLLNLTLNPGMFVTSTADATSAVYQSAGSDLATLSNVSVRVYQNYLDDLPVVKNQAGAAVPLLPPDDLARAVLMNNTVSGIIVANQDNTFQFTNSREFQSLCMVYDNGGVLNAGTDVNYLAVNSANLTAITKLDPIIQSFISRNLVGADFPPGFYYMDFRARPIDTNQSGNMQAVLNPSSAAANAVVLLGWESIGQIGLVNAAGALPSGG